MTHGNSPLFQGWDCGLKLFAINLFVLASINFIKESPEFEITFQVDKEQSKFGSFNVVLANVLFTGSVVNSLGRLKGAHNDGLVVGNFGKFQDFSTTFIDFGQTQVCIAIDVELVPNSFSLGLFIVCLGRRQSTVDLLPIHSTELLLFARTRFRSNLGLASKCPLFGLWGTWSRCNLNVQGLLNGPMGKFIKQDFSSTIGVGFLKASLGIFQGDPPSFHGGKC
mmetsp:Transcript_9149/g.21814  ORF Transcript_9149/g.21814 Transcript_9149/m.21814 type:complete len:223 (+) Transcript_9149:358-1026(+)